MRTPAPAGRLLLPALVLAVLACASCNLFNKDADRRARQRITDLNRQAVHLVRFELEKWSESHNGLYPDSIEELIKNGNFEKFPENAVTRNPMKPVPLGDDSRSGNFTYVPVYGTDSVNGFYLLAYTSNGEDGEDIDGDGAGDGVEFVLRSKGGDMPAIEQVAKGSNRTPPLLFSRLETIDNELHQYGNTHAAAEGPVYPSALPSENGPVTLPQNPFTETPMKQVRIGAEDSPGNFAYVPFVLNGKVRGYYLLGFGQEGTAGYDVDGDGNPDQVVKIISNGPESMPDLSVLIGQLRGEAE